MDSSVDEGNRKAAVGVLSQRAMEIAFHRSKRIRSCWAREGCCLSIRTKPPHVSGIVNPNLLVVLARPTFSKEPSVRGDAVIGASDVDFGTAAGQPIIGLLQVHVAVGDVYRFADMSIAIGLSRID